MRFILVFLVLWTAYAASSNDTTKDYLDPFEPKDQVFLVETLFTKLNTLLNDTAELSRGLLGLNQRLDELSKRQEDQENNSKQFQQEITKRQEDQEKSLKQFQEDLTKRQEDQEKSLKQFQEDLTKRLDKQEKLMGSYLNTTSNWHTILRRQDGSVDFDRTWYEYQNGFGDPNGEFFIGLDRLHAMTTYGPPQELLVVLKDFANQTRYAKYDLLRIGSEAEKYALLDVGTYSGDAGDSLTYDKGHKFSTIDQDNDISDKLNCAKEWKGGWWFHECYYCFLTGPYRNETEGQRNGVNWNEFHFPGSMKFAEMMIRAKSQDLKK